MKDVSNQWKNHDSKESGFLRDFLAGVAGEHHVVHFPMAAGAKIDHFPDVGKMVGNLLSGDFAGSLGLGNDIEEVASFGIAEKVLHIPD